MRYQTNLMEVLAMAERLLEQRVLPGINISKSGDGQWAVKKKTKSLISNVANKEHGNVNRTS